MKKCILIIVIFNLYSCNNDSNRELIKINDIFYSQMFKQMSESINNQNKYIDNYVGEHSYQVDSNTVRNKSILLLDSLMQNKKKILRMILNLFQINLLLKILNLLNFLAN